MGDSDKLSDVWEYNSRLWDRNQELLRHPPRQGVKRYYELYLGYQECFECDGDGVCIVCHGEGMRKGATCSYCNGRRLCTTCKGAGQIPATSRGE
jgi:hypothetical protein